MERDDEARHEPSTDPAWEESWSLDALAPDDATLFVRLTLRPTSRRAWFWAYFVEPGRGILAVRDADVARPKPPGLEVRADGLWADLICETPFEHWSFGLEAFAVRLDDPLDAFRGERGERVPFGLDVEWELSGPPVRRIDGYEQAGTLHGDVLVGSRTVAIEASARRTHVWGVRDWHALPTSRSPVAAVSAVCIPIDLGDGTPVRLVHATVRGGDDSWGVADFLSADVVSGP